MGVRLADIHLSQTLRKAGALCTGYQIKTNLMKCLTAFSKSLGPRFVFESGSSGVIFLILIIFSAKGRDARDAAIGNMAASPRCGSSTQRLEHQKRFSKLKMPTRVSEATISKGGTARTSS
ncbi:hypothetical protein ACFX16_030789 [Malus domestica]